MKRNPAVEQIVQAARRHVVAFAMTRRIPTMTQSEAEAKAMDRAERRLRQAAHRIVRKLSEQRPSSEAKADG
jgi:hypothetical protein